MSFAVLFQHSQTALFLSSELPVCVFWCRRRSDLLDNIPTSRPFNQTWALPPSTNSSIPMTKLKSSESGNNVTFRTSSSSPMCPIEIREGVPNDRAVLVLRSPSLTEARPARRQE